MSTARPAPAGRRGLHRLCRLPRSWDGQPRSGLLRGVVLAVWLAAGVLPAAKAQQAQDILEQTVETYRNLQQYYFEGSVSVVMQAADGQQAMDIEVLMAERKPSRLRAEVESPAMQMTIISDGDTTWMYLPGSNQYMKRAGSFLPGADDAPIPDLLGEFQTLADDVKAVTLLREEGLEVGGAVRPAYVLEVVYEPRETPAGADSSQKTLWIDKDRLIVLKDQTRAHMSGSPFGGPMVVDETTVFTTVRVAEPLPDSLFVFMPPAGATEIDPQTLLGGQPAGLRGQPAEDFTLQSLTGEEVNLSALRGKVVLINFWATWCGPCRHEMPAIEQLYREFADEGLVVLAVDLAEPVEEVRAYIDREGYTFPVLLDTDARVAMLYESAAAVPTTVIIDQEGVITHHFVGARPESVFRDALKSLGFE